MVRSQRAYGAGMIALGPGGQLQPVPAAARMWGSRHRVARTGAGRAPAIAIVILSAERPSAQAGGRAM